MDFVGVTSYKIHILLFLFVISEREKVAFFKAKQARARFGLRKRAVQKISATARRMSFLSNRVTRESERAQIYSRHFQRGGVCIKAAVFCALAITKQHPYQSIKLRFGRNPYLYSVILLVEFLCNHFFATYFKIILSDFTASVFCALAITKQHPNQSIKSLFVKRSLVLFNHNVDATILYYI